VYTLLLEAPEFVFTPEPVAVPVAMVAPVALLDLLLAMVMVLVLAAEVEVEVYVRVEVVFEVVFEVVTSPLLLLEENSGITKESILTVNVAPSAPQTEATFSSS
jgi:hypothetical protein